MTAFALDARIEADSVELFDLRLCTCRLARDGRWPWLILVPKRAGLVELSDLTPPERVAVMDDIADATSVLQRRFTPTKVNVAAIGNMVRQLHIHVAARTEGDAGWPGPIWGHGKAEPRDEATLQALAADLRTEWKNL
ncbi:MAG: HIT family protein [Rhodospirillales bacterium]